MSEYILINILVLIIPFVFSFDKKVHYYKRWKYLFPAIILTGIFFIIWDILFTRHGVWGFNPLYISSVKIANLPPGEWLFFITVPYSSIFIYDVYKAYVQKDLLKPYVNFISSLLIVISFIIAIIYHQKLYTFITFLLLSLTILYFQFIRQSWFMGRFYFAYMIALIPFFIVNGILTGSFIDEEIVWYNNNENMDIRLFTIPLEDIFYGMLLILVNIGIYESLNKKESFR